MKNFFLSMVIFSVLALFPNEIFSAERIVGASPIIQDGKMQDVKLHNMMEMVIKPSDEYSDKAFLSAMIPHHNAAVVMANDVLKNGKDFQVKKWAQDVITAQKAEIVQMSDWLKNLGGEDKKAAEAMNDSMHSMMTSPMDKDADRAFVAMMIDHHAAALEMATKALMRSDDDNIVTLANQIIATQAKEIMEYKQWLKKNVK